ncbi:deazapurine DNA modification protein DpdA family protein [Nocardia gipuzkoensis]
MAVLEGRCPNPGPLCKQASAFDGTSTSFECFRVPRCTGEATRVMSALTTELPGIRLHGLGVETTGLSRYGALLSSADSMAWSYCARRERPLPRRSPTRGSTPPE